MNNSKSENTDKERSAFNLIKRERFYIIQIYENRFTKNQIKEFQVSIIDIILKPANVIIDCFYIDEMEFPAMLHLFILNQQISISNFSIRFVNMTEDLETKLKLSILSQLDAFSKSFLEGIEELQNKKAEEFSFIKSLVTGAVRTFYIQASLPCTRRQTYYKQEEKTKFLANIVAITQVQNGENPYFFCLSFTEKSFLKLMSELLGEEVVKIDENNQDGVAEMANIILGQSRAIFRSTEDKEEITIGIPQVHLGEDCPKLILSNSEFDWENCTAMVIPFASHWGQFFVELFFPKDYSREVISDILMN